MITLSIRDRELLIEVLRSVNNPDHLLPLFGGDDRAGLNASDAIAKQICRLQNWIAEEKSRE